MGATQATPELLGATMSFNSKIGWVIGATLLACLAIAAIGLSLLWQRYPQPTRITTADFILRSEADPQYCNDSDSAVFVLGTPPRTSTITPEFSFKIISGDFTPRKAYVYFYLRLQWRDGRLGMPNGIEPMISYEGLFGHLKWLPEIVEVSPRELMWRVHLFHSNDEQFNPVPDKTISVTIKIT
jgi:hypothetical protein